MANLAEVARSISAFEKIGRRSSLPIELAWVLRETAREDLMQMKNILGDREKPITPLIYAQRLVEVGYIFTEVFLRGEYSRWEPRSNSPRIIDLGGDPGIFSVLYWKYKAPHSQITVVEANPATANVMRKNLERRGLENVQVINAAVAADANENATLHLHKPRKGWHTQDYVGNQGAQDHSGRYTISVPKMKLSELINEGERIDLLKVDIEGSEVEVMRELAESGKLKQIDQIIMEFHHDPVGNPGHSLIEMLDILQTDGFDITEAHITIGKGMRGKRNVPINDIRNITSVNRKIFLTLSATKANKSK